MQCDSPVISGLVQIRAFYRFAARLLRFLRVSRWRVPPPLDLRWYENFLFEFRGGMCSGG